MRTPLHNEQFNDFLKDQVQDHRMYPADQIWRNIQKEVHGDGKWPALTYISIFIITALVFSTLMVKPEERMNKNIAAYPEAAIAATTQVASPQRKTAAESAPVASAYTDNITQQTLQTVSETITRQRQKSASNLPQRWAITTDDAVPQPMHVSKQAFSVMYPSASLKVADRTTADEALADDNTIEEMQNASVQSFVKPASRYFSTIGLMNIAGLKKPSDQQSSLYGNDEIWRTYPLLSTKDIIIKKLSKFNFQFYITPSVSYRLLNDANGKIASAYTALPRTSHYKLDLNHIVQHRPAMGAEVGFALGYKLTNSITVKGGLQFNVRQYNIRAYTIPQAEEQQPLPAENVVASQAIAAPVTDDSYLTSADIAAAESKPVVLSNRYYEIAAPVGVDWRIAASGNNRLTVNVAAAVQPTYTFDKEPFVIASNFKSYTDGTAIMRNWNLNSNVEAYVSYQIGPLRWQIGPQFRYQHFSTYSNKYPVREHLLDYGVKVGFTKSLN